MQFLRRLHPLAVVGAIVAFTSPAAAIDMNAVFPDLNLPGFKVTPFLTERAEYQANVFQAPSRAQDDIIFKTIPGILLELPIGPHRLDMGTRLEFLNYVDLSNQDAIHFFLLGNLALNFPGGLKAGLREDLQVTTDPPGTELTGRIDSTTNTLNPSLEYGFARRYALGVDYTWTHVNFESSAGALDRDAHLFGFTGFWKVAPRTDLLANYSYGVMDFDQSNRDVTRHIWMFGVRGELTSKLTSTFRLGYEVRDSDSGGKSDYAGSVVSGDFVFKPTERTTLTLVTDRSVQESIFATNFWYLQNMVTLAADHQFGPKLSANARLFGATNDYPDKAAKVNNTMHWRHDTLIGYRVGVDYQIQRWLGVGADYAHTWRDSNFENFSFQDDIIGVKVTLSFEARSWWYPVGRRLAA